MTNVYEKRKAQATSPFQKVRAMEIARLYDDGLDPIAMTVHGACGSYRYTYDDIANYMEYNAVPFDAEIDTTKSEVKA